MIGERSNSIIVVFILLFYIIFIYVNTGSENVSGLEQNDQISFSPNIRISPSRRYAYHPSLCVSDEGNVYISWNDCEVGEDFTKIHFRRSLDRGRSFNDSMTVHSIPDSIQKKPDMCLDDEGRVLLIWDYEKSSERSTIFTSSNDQGRSFSETKKLQSENKTNMADQPLVTSSNGTIYIVYRGDDQFEKIIVSKDNGETFGEPYSICEEVVDFIHADQNGNLLVGYTSVQDRVNFIRSTDSGKTWSNPVRLDPGGKGRSVEMDIDTRGTIYLSWTDVSDGLTYFSKSMDGGASFTTPLPVESTSSSILDGDIAVDDWGGVYIVWSENRNENWDVFFSYSLDGGATFYPEIRINDDTGDRLQRDPKICTDAEGNIYVIWEDQRNGVSEIFLSTTPALKHPPRLKVPFPETITIVEDMPEVEPMINISEYFQSMVPVEQIGFKFSENPNNSYFEPVVINGFLGFDQLVENIHGTFDLELIAIDPGDDGLLNTTDDVFSENIPFRLIVTPVNEPPIIIEVDGHFVEDGSIKLNAVEDIWFNSSIVCIEMDGEEIWFSSVTSGMNFSIDQLNGSFSFFPTNNDVGIIEILIVVSDYSLLTDQVTLVFNVSNTNDPPIPKFKDIYLEIFEDELVLDINFTEWFSDPDGDGLSIALIFEYGCFIFFTPNDTVGLQSYENWTGDVIFLIEGNDGEFTSSFNLHVKVKPVNDEPYEVHIEERSSKYYENGEYLFVGYAKDI